MTRPTNNIALAFQEVFTVVLRTRYEVQSWPSADAMRQAVRRMIATGAQNVRAMGYSDEITQMALYAIIGFLDENILSTRNPVFADWHGFPLQQEMFKTMVAGEIFFQHVAELLNRPDTADVADMLEVHCLCLLLGFRGRYLTGDASQIDGIVRRIRDKIVRIRGPFVLLPESFVPEVRTVTLKDRLLRSLTITTLALGGLTVLLFLAYLLILNSAMPHVVAALAEVAL